MQIINVFLIVLVAFFGFQYLMMFRMKLKKGKAAPELSGVYGKAIKGKKTSLFYFYSPSCGPCRTMTPVVGEYTKNNPRCFKVDISKDMKTAQAFGVMGTPSTVLVENGKIRDFIVGPKPVSDFRKLLELTRN